MKRIFLTALTATAMALLTPGLAAASHHGRSHGHAHRGHHAARTTRPYGALLAGTVADSRAPSPAQSTGADDSHGQPAAPSTTPAAPGAPATAGTVRSFTGGVLTITLTDGSTVSGRVDEQTEIQCQAATPLGGTAEEPVSPAEDGEGGEEGTEPVEEDQATESDQATEDDHAIEDDQATEDDQAEGGACTSTALVAGTVVLEADLSVGGSGAAVWEHITLVH